MSISGQNLVHDFSTWPESQTTYTFQITAVDSDGLSSSANITVTISGPPPFPLSNSILPNWHTPQINLASATPSNGLTWSRPSNLPSNTIIHMLLVGSGGGSHTSRYENRSDWNFSGQGGSALLIITTAGNADGMNYNIQAGGSPIASWMAGEAKPTTVTIDGTTYSTYHQNSNQCVFLGDGATDVRVPSGFSNDYYSMATTGATTGNISVTPNSGEQMWGNGNDTGSSTTSGGSNTFSNVILAAGNGYATYGGTGYQTSTYSGNGASGGGQNGTAPGGGASALNTSGGRGSIRIYY
jgi:hypothetical protein